MASLRALNISVSLDGFMAGPRQDVEHPLGIGGERLHEWVFATAEFRRMEGLGPGGDTGLDDDYIRRGVLGIGATIMGRNMFGPIRGSWPDGAWTGWWGPNPPFHHPVFVLTHHPRPPLEMDGGTVFTFVTGGIEAAYEQAFAAADGLDVRLGGGAGTIRAYMQARLLDELHVAVVPVLLGSGERLFVEGLESDSYVRAEMRASAAVCHVTLVRGEA